MHVFGAKLNTQIFMVLILYKIQSKKVISTIPSMDLV